MEKIANSNPSPKAQTGIIPDKFKHGLYFILGIGNSIVAALIYFSQSTLAYIALTIIVVAALIRLHQFHKALDLKAKQESEDRLSQIQSEKDTLQIRYDELTIKSERLKTDKKHLSIQIQQLETQEKQLKAQLDQLNLERLKILEGRIPLLKEIWDRQGQIVDTLKCDQNLSDKDREYLWNSVACLKGKSPDGNPFKE
ncbi:MAG: DUF3450 domain-containing protein [Bacteroidales bacterium]|nr:DUF3450 domain-containing protein [Candidatus Latescibacterota bacterium]